MEQKSRSNSRLNCNLIEVARLYATHNLTEPTELKHAELILSLISRGQYQLAKKELDDFARPEFGSPIAYFARRQFYALVAKVPFKGSSTDRKRAAVSAFYKAEAQCRRANKKLRHYHKYPNRMPEIPRVILSRARGYVRQVLGRLDEDRLSQIYGLCRPGSGVAIGTHNRFRVSLPYKLSDTDLSVTPRAEIYAQQLIKSSPGWFQLVAEPYLDNLLWRVPTKAVTSNRFTFVPKDARTLRTIAIEPALNVWLQLGIHSYIAGRLKSFGNDIEDQSRNQKLAAFGSTRTLGHSVSTLDLSSASDTVSIEIVRCLLPSDWFGLLDDLRCHSGDLEGDTLTMEKFSSMGNGFTFALETLLFWALAQAVHSFAGGEISPSVYGDDIIVSDNEALLLTEVLEWCGFSLNLEKSYVLGPFRESCGADWHTGYRVTPQYIKKAFLRPTDVYLLLNRCDPILNWGAVRKYLLAKHCEVEPILFGLENEDASSCLFTTFAYAKGGGLLKWHPDWQTYTFQAWSFKPESERVSSLTAYVTALFGAKGRENRYQLRGRGTFRLIALTPGVNQELPRFIP